MLNIQKKYPELLSPAGDPDKLIMAVTYGADAVYLAGNAFGMRVAAGNFSDDDLRSAIEYCHQNGVLAYVTINTVAHSQELDKITEFAEKVSYYGADAAIVSDLGVFSRIQKVAPSLELHVSTQAGVTNYDTANMWHQLGAKRVILARELSLKEIAELRAKTSKDLEIECFVHGAMCVSFSGRCLLSEYMTGRDANGGACAQPCRWKYYLREEKRPGELFEIEEYPEGTYIMNSKDLNAIRILKDLKDAGINSFKIEGRAKSEYYAAAVTHAYRGAIDDLEKGLPFNEKWYGETCKVSHREYSEGFFYGRNLHMQHDSDSSYIRDWDVSAIVEECAEDGNAIIKQKNRFKTDDTLELMIPRQESIPFVVGEMIDANNLPTTDAMHPHMLYKIKLPKHVPQNSILRKQKDQQAQITP